jgi:hypothetical protein
MWYCVDPGDLGAIVGAKSESSGTRHGLSVLRLRREEEADYSFEKKGPISNLHGWSFRHRKSGT